MKETTQQLREVRFTAMVRDYENGNLKDFRYQLRNLTKANLVRFFVLAQVEGIMTAEEIQAQYLI